MVGKTNVAGAKLFAAIGVTYPAGSTLTCTNGEKTLTAKTTSGQWVFAIPEAGTWTVTATDGTNSKSQSVEISSEGQFETVMLSYRLYLFKQNEGDTSAWEPIFGGLTNASVTTEKLTLSGGTDVYYSSRVAITKKNAVDVTNYSKLVFDVQTDQVANSSSWAWVGIAKDKFTEQANVTKDNSAAYTDLSTTTRNEVVVDISNISGACYAYVASDGLNINTNAYNIWLE